MTYISMSDDIVESIVILAIVLFVYNAFVLYLICIIKQEVTYTSDDIQDIRRIVYNIHNSFRIIDETSEYDSEDDAYSEEYQEEAFDEKELDRNECDDNVIIIDGYTGPTRRKAHQM